MEPARLAGGLQFVSRLRRHVRDGRQILFEMLAATGGGFASQVIHGHYRSQLFASGTSEELTDRVALLRSKIFALLLQLFPQLDGQCAHHRARTRSTTSAGATTAPPSSSY